jgi:hypothetical protein
LIYAIRAVGGIFIVPPTEFLGNVKAEMRNFGDAGRVG